MNLGQQLLFFFSALGAFNGLIISAYLLFFKKPKSTTSIFLGLLLLSLCLKIGKSFIFYFYPELPSFYIHLGILGSALVGPSLFYFVSTALGTTKNVNTTQKLTYLFWILSLGLTSLMLPYHNHPDLWNNYIGNLISLQLVIYMVITAWLLLPVFTKLWNTKEKITSAETLVLSVFIGNVAIPSAFKLSIFSFFNGPCISGALFFSLVLYLNLLLFVSRRKTSGIFAHGQDLGRYSNKKMEESHVQALTAKLERILAAEQLYKNPDLKLNDLAKMINISGHQLSQLLNDNLGKSFAAYINEYRINEACLLITNNNSIKLEAIGYEVGFNSKSTFYTAFKKHKQTTPTLYKEQLLVVSST